MTGQHIKFVYIYNSLTDEPRLPGRVDIFLLPNHINPGGRSRNTILMTLLQIGPKCS